jgi:transposase
LKHAVELYEYYREKIEECEQELENYLKELPRQREDEPPPSPGGEKRTRMSFNMRDHLWKLTGVDLFQVKGLSADTLLTIYSEVGGDMSRFENAKRFSSWLRLCPGTRKSGGKVLSGRTLPSKNRAAAAFRQAASTLGRSDTALGAFYRRIAGRKGRPEAVTATAHKLARIYYSLMKHGTAYVEESAAKSEEKYRASQLKRLSKQVAALGYELTPKAA